MYAFISSINKELKKIIKEYGFSLKHGIVKHNNKKYDISGINNLFNLNFREYFNLLKIQKFKDPIDKSKFIYDKEQRKFLDPSTGLEPVVNYHPKTGRIKGILTYKTNLIERDFILGYLKDNYIPKKIIDYTDNFPAKKINLEIYFKLNN